MESSSVEQPAETEECLMDSHSVPDGDNDEEDGDKIISDDKYTAPCIICGTDLEATIPPSEEDGGAVIKQEVDLEDQFGRNLNEEDGYLVSGAKVNTGAVYQADSSILSASTKKEDNTLLYHWFVKLFGLEGKSDKKGGGSLVNKSLKFWWGTTGEPQIPFCLLCKNELIQLLEFKRKVEELENLIQLGRNDLKERCRRSEVIFQKKNVYHFDKRYRIVRKRIINVKSQDSMKPSSSLTRLRKRKKEVRNQSPPPNPEVKNPTVRKSGRQSKPAIKYDPSLFDEDDFSHNVSSIPGAIPMVLLSTSDKVIAEQYLPNPFPNHDNPKNKQSKSKPNRKSPKQKKLPKNSQPSTKVDPDTNDLPTSYPEDPSVSFEDNFDDNDNHDDNINDEDFNPSQKNKKRQPKDEDFIPSELQNDEDDSSNSEDDLPTFKRYRANIIHDPIQNTLTFNKITLKQVGFPESDLYECTSCNAKVHNSKGRIRHHVIKYHTTEFACSKCDYRGGRPSELHVHIKTVHKGVPRVYHDTPCEICGKPLKTSHIKSHLWTHMNKEEKKAARLEEEQKEKEGKSFLHFVVKKYQCDECGRKFSIPSTLEKHIKRVHDGQGKTEVKDKEELCPECGMKFANLQIHMVKKHGDRKGEEEKRKFECMEPGCGKKFKDNAQLWRHKDCVHRNLRPWKCTMCTRAFGKKKSLDNHVNLHLGIREWRCEECDGMGFARKHHLERHRKTFHEDGCRPRRKGYMRGPTTIGMGWTKGELVRKGSYYPPSALASWAQGRVPGYLVEGAKEGVAGEGTGVEDGSLSLEVMPEEKIICSGNN